MASRWGPCAVTVPSLWHGRERTVVHNFMQDSMRGPGVDECGRTVAESGRTVAESGRIVARGAGRIVAGNVRGRTVVQNPLGISMRVWKKQSFGVPMACLWRACGVPAACLWHPCGMVGKGLSS